MRTGKTPNPNPFSGRLAPPLRGILVRRRNLGALNENKWRVARREGFNIDEVGKVMNPGQWFRRVSLFWLIGCGLPLLGVVAVVASFVSMWVWTSRVQAMVEDLRAQVEDLQTHSTVGRRGATLSASLSVRPSKVLLKPSGGFALVFEPPPLAWHTRVDAIGITDFIGGTNDVIVEYRDGEVHTIWWGID